MSQETDARIVEDLLRFYADPLGFVMWAYPWKRPGVLEQHDGPDSWQRESLIEIGRQVKERKFDGVHPVEPIRIACVSGHGIGKSVWVAWLCHWIMSTRPHARGTVTATTFSQLATKTWAAVQSWGKLLTNKHWFEWSSDQMWKKGHKESWAVSAQACKEEQSEAFAGQHSAGSSSFYIFDEASGVPEKIWEVAEGGQTDGEPFFIACGNPTRASGRFYRVTFGDQRNRWTKFSVDSRQSKFSNKALIQSWADDYGEDSSFFRVRVRGLPPHEGANQLISAEAVALCRKYISRGHEALPKILSVDVARFGDSRTVIGLRQGRCFRILAKLSGLDTQQVAMRVIQFADLEKVDACVIDADGVGGGVVDAMKYRGHTDRLFEFHGSARPMKPHIYFNRRAEVWGLMGEWLKAGAQIPDDPELETDLLGPQYGFSGKQQIQLETKDSMNARGVASPDCADALAYSFAVNVTKKQKVWIPRKTERMSFWTT